MAGKTDYSATNWLAYITGKTAMPATPTAFIGLFTTAPTSNSGVTGAVEVSGGSYARQSTSGATWNAPSNSVGSEPSVTPASTSNAVAITFPTATANWGTVTSFGIFDALSSGNLLFWDYIGNFLWLPASVTLASPGLFTSHAHGYSNGDPVVITSKYGGTIPTTGGSFTGVLTVAGATTDTFNVGVNTTSSGDVLVRKILQQVVNAGVQFSLGIGAMVLTDS